MAVVEVHVTVFAPENGPPVAQTLIRERVATVPPMFDALREIDWVLVKDKIRELTAESASRVVTQIEDYEVYLEARSTMPDKVEEPPDDLSNGGGG